MSSRKTKNGLGDNFPLVNEVYIQAFIRPLIDLEDRSFWKLVNWINRAFQQGSLGKEGPGHIQGPPLGLQPLVPRILKLITNLAKTDPPHL